MKIARFTQGETETYGLIRNGKVATKDEIIYHTGVPIPQSIKDFLFDGWFDEVKNKLKGLLYQQSLLKFKLLAPIPNPSKIICLSFNYSDHAKEQELQPPTEPVIFFKPRTALCGSDDDIICPRFVKQLDYEIELAVIIGKNCKNIAEKETADVIFGYMIFNDVSARDIQFNDKQFTRGKSFDTFAPCGPWITSSDEIKDPHNLKMITYVNGQIRQNSNTGNMFLKIPQIISKLSKVMMLEKGDVIATGTPSGVVLKNPNLSYLQDGDVIKMEIENLGKITNTVRFVS
jgi:2-keto-4-pentenoate hydratase/2-oxohepta-3-ene-1,7-dioic acid hydratase in catechol pathway